MPDIEASPACPGKAVDEAKRKTEAEHGGAGRLALRAETGIEQV